MRDFLGKMPLVDLAPDTSTLKHAAGASARVLSSPAGDYGMYFDGADLSEVTLDLPAGTYAGEWLNVETGRVERPESFHHAGGDKLVRPPAYQEGIALRLKRSSP